MCTNTDSSFECSCGIGYKLRADILDCEGKRVNLSTFSLIMHFSDLDECLTNNGGCNQTCTNSEGSFECSCRTGYRIEADNFGCEGKIFNSNDNNSISIYFQMLMSVMQIMADAIRCVPTTMDPLNVPVGQDTH